MPAKDGFDPTHPLPQFLADRAEQGIGNASNPEGAVAASRAFKVSILIATATATGIAVLAMGNPVGLLAEMSASLVSNSTPQPTPAIQSTADAPALVAIAADAHDLPPTTNEAPTRGEVAASEPADKDQSEKSEAASETLFRQFQAWAADQDAQAHGGSVQPAQDAPALVVQNDPAPAAKNIRVPYRQVQKRRQARAAVRNARAEVRAQNLRKQIPRAQDARAERPPTQDARAQDQSVQNAQQPSFLSIFGQRN
jgi:hypothetical protein